MRIPTFGMAVVRATCVALLLVILGACESTGSQQTLQTENQRLTTELDAARQQIAALQAERAELRGTVTEQSDVIGVLTNEKSSTDAESSRLRGQARTFVRDQMKSFREFLQTGGLLDYVGGERVARSQQDSAPGLLVDSGHPLPRGGTVSGVSGWFTAPGNLQVKVLRPLEDRYVVLWESPMLEVASGARRIEFPVAVGVDSGDVIAYWFPDSVNVPWDRGTGDVRIGDRALRLGQTVRMNDFGAADERRAYSIGVTGFLD